MTNNVVDLKAWREKKKKTVPAQAYRDSLNNDKVMQRYNIKQPTIEERTQRIAESIARINGLMKELEDKNK
jgi:hypothetical protein